MKAIEKFQKLLKDIFQFESSDLDFGIYRIINYKRQKINKFIEIDLQQKVESAFNKHKKQIVDKIEESEKIDEIKNQVFNDLYNFFSRYYEEGDFVPQYRYSIKNHKYSIPYNGEEVKLYWVNQDQYYIKTGLLFKDYTFKANDYKITFRTVSAKEEIASNKATKERFFLLNNENPLQIENKTLFIRFQYRELTVEEVKFYDIEGGSNTSKQEKINQKTYDNILNNIKDINLKAILTKEYKNEKPLLLYQINRFTAKNTKDYFIHKNLKKFLSEQLDYFIKSEVLDIETLEKERFLDKHITRAKVVREIGEDIIDFLSQIEDFQKKLWKKKKFVIKTEYVITLDKIKEYAGEDFFNEVIEEIFKNGKQLNEWKELGFGEIKNKNDLLLKNDLIQKIYKKLPIDTKYFSQNFKERLIEKLTENQDLDDICDGLLIKSENWQALNLLLNKYKEKIQTIYIDPPYNTGSDEFLYKDRYQHSCWLTMMENRLSIAKELMKDDGVIFVSIDDNEVNYLNILLKNILHQISTIKIFSNPRGRQSSLNIAISSEYVLCYSKKDRQVIKGYYLTQEKIKQYSLRDEKGNYRLLELRHRGSGSDYYYIESMDYPIFYNPLTQNISLEEKEGYIRILPRGKTGKGRWTWSKEKLEKNKNLIVIKQTKSGNWRVFRKDYLKEEERTKPLDMWIEKEINYDRSSEEIKSLFNQKIYTFAKPLYLINKILEIVSSNDSIILDFFAGSGTTAHAVMKLNKEDNNKRKFILVEMANYFDTVIIPRIKKVAYSFNWKNGKPQDNNGIGIFFKYQILEQYEDTLDNIELQENQKAMELFKDEYLLKYFLDMETRESPYLLNIANLKNPFGYKLKVNLSEVGEPQEMIVDIPETFNYLLGIKVKKVKVRNNQTKYVFILGEKENKDIAIVWREYNHNWKEEDFKNDKDFIIKEIENWKPHIVYVNGQSTLTPLNWEIRYIEPEFKKLMELTC